MDSIRWSEPDIAATHVVTGSTVDEFRHEDRCVDDSADAAGDLCGCFDDTARTKATPLARRSQR